MKHWKQRLAAGSSALALTLTLGSGALAAGSDVLTRGQARDIIAAAADDYITPTMADILQGDETGDLHLERPLTRAEALELCAKLRSRGIKCRIMSVPVGERGDTELR